MENFEKDFEKYCKTPNVNSGKASSYAKAIRYLCDYMEITELSEDAINKIKNIEDSIKDKDSMFYSELLKFLKARKQSSYLENGFIQAALSYFYLYMKEV